MRRLFQVPIPGGKVQAKHFSLDGPLLVFMTSLAPIGLTSFMHPPLGPSRLYPTQEWWFLK